MHNLGLSLQNPRPAQEGLDSASDCNRNKHKCVQVTGCDLCASTPQAA